MKVDVWMDTWVCTWTWMWIWFAGARVSWIRIQLARVHEVERVQRSLDGSHDSNRLLPKLAVQKLALAHPNAVLQHTRAHAERERERACREGTKLFCQFT